MDQGKNLGTMPASGIAIIIVIITKYQPRYDKSCFFNVIPTAVARMKRLRKPKQEKSPLAFIAMNVDS